MGTETEIKLSFSDAVDPLAWLEPVLAGLKVESEGSPRQLRNRYFDTDDRQLKAWGMGLRIRQAGEHREQTLKTAGTGVAGLSQRPEYNLPLAGDVPVLADFPAEIWPDGTDLAGLQQSLTEQFCTHFERRTWLVSDGSNRIEIALDMGQVEAGGLVLPIRELELELVGGDVDALLALAGKLLAQDGVQMMGLSKAARGHWVAQGMPTLAVKAKAPRAGRRMGNDQVLQAALLSALEQWQQGEDALALTQDPRFLVELDRALQYFRQVLQLFGALVPRKASSELRQECQWLSDELQAGQALARISKVLEGKGAFLKKVLAKEALLAQAESRLHSLPPPQRFVALVRSQRYSQLKLAALSFALQRGWRPELDDKALAQLDKPVKWFADTQLARTHGELKKHLKPELSRPDLQDQESRILKAATVARTFLRLYDGAAAQPFLQLLEDLGLGLEELKRLDGIEQLARRLDLEEDEEEQLGRWLRRKRDSLMLAMEQSRRQLMQLPVYWP
ncbi:CYTH domain-containing protein [Gallaecimonas sp. GXIMD4217]|uniref:CYTH and CHAD domain-containing protein n=1 Tax=Gallaecimonas sp. GXIMD4217 TaxID=3131927 RepID=UPI00311AC9CF